MFGTLVRRFLFRFLVCATVFALLAGVSGTAQAGIFRRGHCGGAAGNGCQPAATAAAQQRPAARIFGRAKPAEPRVVGAAPAPVRVGDPGCASGKCNLK